MSNPFTFINSINNKDYIFDEISEKEYKPFMVNNGLSYFPDTVLLANEMNKCPSIPNKAQYDFLYHSVSKRKRFSKWVKKEEATDNLQLIMDYYEFSETKAKEALSILTDAQIDEIKISMEKGGRKSKRGL